MKDGTQYLPNCSLQFRSFVLRMCMFRLSQSLPSFPLLPPVLLVLRTLASARAEQRSRLQQNLCAAAVALDRAQRALSAFEEAHCAESGTAHASAPHTRAQGPHAAAPWTPVPKPPAHRRPPRRSGARALPHPYRHGPAHGQGAPPFLHAERAALQAQHLEVEASAQCVEFRALAHAYQTAYLTHFGLRYLAGRHPVHPYLLDLARRAAAPPARTPTPPSDPAPPADLDVAEALLAALAH